MELNSGLIGPLNTLLYSEDLRINDWADLSLSGCGCLSKFSTIQSFCSPNGSGNEPSRVPK
jgi:hypothetical protein